MSVFWRVIDGIAGIVALVIAVLMLTTSFEPPHHWGTYLLLGVLLLGKVAAAFTPGDTE